MACVESSENFYISRCFGCLMVYTLGYFIRWQRIARFAILVPITACIVAIFTASESPVYLVSQNKVVFEIIIRLKQSYYLLNTYIFSESEIFCMFCILQIEQARTVLTRLYGPKYKVPEEVEIIRLNLQRRAEVSGIIYFDDILDTELQEHSCICYRFQYLLF